MKALVVYDSVFGNTEQIARAIGKALASHIDVNILRASDVKPEHLGGLKLLIVGSPTRQFRPTAAITRFLKGIARDGLNGVSVAVFDTRFKKADIEKTPVLPFFVKIFGYAAKPMANRLEKKGAELVIPPEGFYVNDTEGPLKEGELERAADWAKRIIAEQANC